MPGRPSNLDYSRGLGPSVLAVGAYGCFCLFVFLVCHFHFLFLPLSGRRPDKGPLNSKQPNKIAYGSTETDCIKI